MPLRQKTKLTMVAKSQMSPRAECYHALRHEFGMATAKYLKKHPELVKHPDTEDGLTATMALMHNVITLLDKYDIGKS